MKQKRKKQCLPRRYVGKFIYKVKVPKSNSNIKYSERKDKTKGSLDAPPLGETNEVILYRGGRSERIISILRASHYHIHPKDVSTVEG